MTNRAIFVALALVALTASLIVVVAVLAASTLRAQTSSSLSDVVADATARHRFSLLSYELTHLPNRWLASVAEWFDESDLDEDAILQRWFERTDERDRKKAELLLERRLSQAVSELQLDSSLPLFGRVRAVWPPIDVDLSERLHVLAVSPRDEIRMIRSALLTSNLEREDYDQIEREIEADGRWSAWVGRVGGVALYPASVVSSRDYLSTLQIMAHEWTHHYLGFYSLGLAYGRGSDMRTINETVADIVGDELGDAAAQIPGFAAPATNGEEERRGEIRAATDPILRQLRLDVDALLSEDRIDEAEQLMDETRQQLIELNRPFRRINQAFLAFRGGYGASPSSPSLWGERLLSLRASTTSLPEFLILVRDIGSPAEADALLPP